MESPTPYATSLKDSLIVFSMQFGAFLSVFIRYPFLATSRCAAHGRRANFLCRTEIPIACNQFRMRFKKSGHRMAQREVIVTVRPKPQRGFGERSK
jgi:hypothetical protein